MSGQSFQDKALRVTFTLASGSFQGSNNQIILTNLRTIATITGALNFLTQLDLQIYGMLPQDMNALSVIIGVQGFPTAIGKNQVLLEGNQGAGWYTLFNGLLVEGGPEYRGMPETFFHCQAVPAGYYQGLQPGSPAYLSYASGASVEVIVQSIASAMGVLAYNNGVTATVPAGTYLPGAPIDQLRALVAKSGNAFTWTFDPDNSLVILPTNKPRQNGPQLVLSPASGLVGYPTIEAYGIGVVALFDPALLLGNTFQIQGSSIPAANGTWMPYDMTLQLEALKIGGSQWLASMHCQQVAS